jgi:hypothetical protein
MIKFLIYDLYKYNHIIYNYIEIYFYELVMR